MDTSDDDDAAPATESKGSPDSAEVPLEPTVDASLEESRPCTVSAAVAAARAALTADQVNNASAAESTTAGGKTVADKKGEDNPRRRNRTKR